MLGVLLAAAVPVAVADAAVDTDLHVGGPGCSDAGPGSANQPFCTIGAAAAATVPGSTVVVAAGTYAESVSPPVSGTAAAPIVFTAAPAAVVTVAGGTYGFRLSKRSWITVRGFRVQDTSSNGMYVGYGSGIALEGNRVSRSGTRVSGSGAAGIYLTATKDSSVSGNTVEDNSASGIYLTNGTTRVTVSGNESMGNAFGWQRNANGIDVRAPGNAIVGNRTHDNEDSGIQVYPGADDTLVAGNTSSNNLGFTTTAQTNCSHPVTGNTAGCILGDHGIDNLRVTGSTVIGNTVYGNASAGINLEGIVDGTTSRAVIRNNISVDNAVRCPNGAGGTTPCPRTLGNLRVDATSQLGTSVDRDVVWLTSPGTMMTWGKTRTATLAEFQAISGQEGTGRQADPRLRSPLQGDLSLLAGSAAIDMADSGAPGQRTTDIDGRPRIDDPATANSGTGPRAYDDAGALEFQPPDPAPSPTLSPSAP